jgi:polyketide synthase PksJ/polyketide synthase PksN
MLLKTQGIQVITVTMGNEFRQLSEFEYVINPGVKADYQSLMKELFRGENEALGAHPEYILHLWNVTSDETVPSQFGDSRLQFAEACQTQGFLSLMYLAQSLGEEELSNLVRLGIVSNNLYAIAGEPVFQPEKAVLLGPAKVIPREYPRLICQAIDLTLPQPGQGNARDAETRLMNLILAEVTSPRPEFLVAFRGGQRWRQVFEPIQLKETRPQDWLKPGGTYLITGGLGGIGLTLADYLAKKDRIKLVLTRRSFFPPRDEWKQWLSTHGADDSTSKVIGKIQVIEKSGTEIMAAKADVTNLEEMRTLFGEVTRGFGPITGVFHAAGVADNGLIQEKTVATSQKVLDPKVSGTLVLDQLLRESECPPEMMVLFSSSSAVLGNAGFIDYCAANNFLDAYSAAKSTNPATYTVAINWDEWEEVGMAAASGIKDRVKERIHPQAGLELLDRILSHRAGPQIVVSPGDFITMLKAIREFLEGAAIGQAFQEAAVTRANNRPRLSVPYMAPRNEMENEIVKVWEEILGVSPIGVQDDFFDLGGHSLLATTLVAKLGRVFHQTVSLQQIFQNSTVEQLTQLMTGGKAGVKDEEEGEFEEGEI